MVFDVYTRKRDKNRPRQRHPRLRVWNNLRLGSGRGCRVAHWQTQFHPNRVRHLVVVLQMVADKNLLRLDECLFLVIFRLQVHLAGRRGLTLLVKCGELVAQGFKCRKLVHRQIQFHAVFLGVGKGSYFCG